MRFSRFKAIPCGVVTARSRNTNSHQIRKAKARVLVHTMQIQNPNIFNINHRLGLQARLSRQHASTLTCTFMQELPIASAVNSTGCSYVVHPRRRWRRRSTRFPTLSRNDGDDGLVMRALGTRYVRSTHSHPFFQSNSGDGDRVAALRSASTISPLKVSTESPS
ncbi:hypothetical protein EXIGLDRAFT_720673 [Exidia glandulosa HHB12029]|uniref:Uncharacterized protein n=1 Tax=Exidia glandulosa HHB12029 TaxID=1314781 RepID=A0A165G7L7_EXIGL|nr:hypothetical protein EXIGLDRAFT_720673 [Exidia glandulosa HHB12029]